VSDVRAATAADEQLLRRLWEEFQEGRPDWVEETWDDYWAKAHPWVEQGLVLLVGEDAFVVASVGEDNNPQVGELVDLYVRPDARRRGYARALIAAATARMRELGARHVQVAVGSNNEPGQHLYYTLGFSDMIRVLIADLTTIEEQAQPEAAVGETFGSVHVQTDDRATVERAVTAWLPRVGGSGGTAITEPRNGWIAVYDEHCDRDPQLLRRLAKELSDRMGAVVLAIGCEDGVVGYALLERGSVMDEYLSVPEHFRPLVPGDVIAMAANPTVVARLTGADPAVIRAVAPTAPSRSDVPPARELLAQLGEAMHVEGVDVGYDDVS
jgi:ribosomal protein S18 acetylase RimI-like enzyme